MSKRKGLSVEEKRTRLMQLFYEKKEVYQLKELERIAPKEKGIVSQSVKEVLQSLVDDGLVDTDKIGTSVYFWAFSSKSVNIRQQKLENLKCQLDDCRKKSKRLEDQICIAQKGREDTDDRNALLEELNSLEIKVKDLKDELSKYQFCDPEAIRAIRQQNSSAKEATNRWTDNIYSIKSWCKNKFFIEEEKLDKQFSIPEDMDYIN